MAHPMATWNPARGVWETGAVSLCGHSEPFSVTWPTSGTTRAGRAFQRPTLVPPTAGSGCSSPPSLLPTPQAHDAEKPKTPEQVAVMRARGHGVSNLNETVEHTLLPTPAAHDSGNTPEDHLRKKPGREVVTSLQVIVDHGLIPTGGRLLPTPTTQDGANTGGPSQLERNTPPLNAVAPTLLPTPMGRDAKGAALTNRSVRPDTGRERPPSDGALPDAVGMLLPTPEAKLSSSGPDYARMEREGSGGHDLVTALALLPTPKATDGTKGGPNQRGSSGDLTMPSAVMQMQLLPTPTVGDSKNAARHTTTTGVMHPGTTLVDAARTLEPPAAPTAAPPEPPEEGLLLPTPMTAYSSRSAEKWRAERPAGNGATREVISDLRIVLEEVLPESTGDRTEEPSDGGSS